MSQVSSSIRVRSTYQLSWWARSPHQSEFIPSTSSLDEPGLFINQSSFHLPVLLMEQVSSSIIVLSTFPFPWWARSLHLSEFFPPTSPLMSQVFSSIRVLSTYQSLDEPGLFFIYQSSFHVTVPLMSQVSSSIRVLSIYQFSWWARSLHLSKFFPPTISVMNQVSSSIRVLSTYPFPRWVRFLHLSEFFLSTSSLDERGPFIIQSSFHLSVPLMSQVSSSIRVCSTYQFPWWARSFRLSEFVPPTSSLDEPCVFIYQSSFHLPVTLMSQVSSSIRVLSTYQSLEEPGLFIYKSSFHLPVPLMSQVSSSIRVCSTYQFPWWARSFRLSEFVPPTSSIDEPGPFIYQSSFHLPVPWWARSLLHLSEFFPRNRSLDEPGLFVYQSSFHLPVLMMSQVSSSIKVLSTYHFRDEPGLFIYQSSFHVPITSSLDEPGLFIYQSSFYLPVPLMSQVSLSTRVLSTYQFPWWARSLHLSKFFPPTSSLVEPGLFIYQSSFHVPVPLMNQDSSSIRVRSTYQFPWWARSLHQSEFFPPTSYLDEPGLFINHSFFHLPVPLMSQVSSSINVLSTYQFPWWTRSLHLSEFFPRTRSLDEPGLFIYQSSFHLPVPLMSHVSSSIRVLSTYQFLWWAWSLHQSEFLPPTSSLDEPGLFIYQSSFHLPVPLMSQVSSSIRVLSMYLFPWWARSLHLSEFFLSTSSLDERGIFII